MINGCFELVYAVIRLMVINMACVYFCDIMIATFYNLSVIHFEHLLHESNYQRLIYAYI